MGGTKSGAGESPFQPGPLPSPPHTHTLRLCSIKYIGSDFTGKGALASKGFSKHKNPWDQTVLNIQEEGHVVKVLCLLLHPGTSHKGFGHCKV